MATPVAIPPDWRKMKKEDLRLELAIRGLDTNGLRPSLIHRLESSCKAIAAAALGAENLPPRSASNYNFNPNPNPSHSDPSRPEPQETSPSPQASKTSSGASDLALQASTQAAQKSPNKPDFKEGICTGPFSPLTDLEKRQMRAERFGVQLRVSEEEKRKMRASRFGGCAISGKASVSEPEIEKRKQRAVRFGIVDDESRKKARQERFSPLIAKKSHFSDVANEKGGAVRVGPSGDQTDVDVDQLVETKDFLQSNGET